MHQQQLTTVFT